MYIPKWRKPLWTPSLCFFDDGLSSELTTLQERMASEWGSSCTTSRWASESFPFFSQMNKFFFCSLPFSNDRCSWFGENFFQLMYPCSANLTNFPFLKGKPYQFSSCKLQWNYETSSNCFYFPLFLHVMCTCLC